MISPVILIQSGPSTAAKVLSAVTYMTVRNALKVGCHAPRLPWPYGLVEFAARCLPKPCGTQTSKIQLPNCTAQLVKGRGITPAHEGKRAILYLHGGGFLVCGPRTHTGIISRLSRYAACPVLAVDYRMCPDHSLDEAISDCLDGYAWLRQNYEAGEIVIAGDSAGGYLALSTAIELRWCGDEKPAALALMSPLLQLNPEPKKKDTNAGSDAMLCPEVFDTLATMVKEANGGGLYEPLNWVTQGLPPVLIHVSGSELLLHDAEVAARRLTECDVPVTLRVWPGQIHVFQIAAPLVPEAERSLKQIGAFVVVSTLPKTDSLKCLTECTRAVQ